METKSNSGQSHTPRLIGETGEITFGFDFNDQKVQYACGVTHANNFFIYGGNENKQQILQVTNCSLSPIGTLPFNHTWAACDSTNGFIILCFDENDAKQCRQATTPLGEWSDMALSTYHHKYTQIAASPGKLVNCRHLK